MSLPDTASANAAQIDYWNTAVGQTWVEHQAQLDRLIAPLGAEAMRVLAPTAGERILDVGCGCGETTLELAARVGPGGGVVGVDISEPMLAVARARDLPVNAVEPQFRNSDAQVADLGEAAFDAIFSRFGVMFFSDPAAAFANLHRAVRPGGRLAFVCWRPYAENLWMRAPMDAAQPFLPPMPASDPLAPGPFAFADPLRVRSILEGAGFSDVTLDPFDTLIGGSSVAETLRLNFRVGPLGSALRTAPHLAARVSQALEALLESYDTPQGVMMPACVWIVQARR
ncbi:class I SAM-dependent methyltransferase [Caulobacter henricii]|uniref:Methyltransferase domain-containing protein n=1 Tax=Caulobacter henricii TaxID=69395 RepID=A0A0P0NY00_9CAUL|nr:class I SAM-dependent methyltransferase [Caulobacter henricii]ALL12636.1 hypothetical protein AQ619_04280 [Caulobacter henricii]